MSLPSPPPNDSEPHDPASPVQPNQPLPSGLDSADAQPTVQTGSGDPPALLVRTLQLAASPQAVSMMMGLGSVLALAGAVVWLVSLGVFKDPHVAAAGLATGTLGVLGLGWWLTLATRYQTAGKGLAGLACLLAPLNLWFYVAQDLLQLDEGLWLPAAALCGLYGATVWALRDPKFMLSIPVGLTATVMLLVADVAPGQLQCLVYCSAWITGLGFAWMMGERLFLADESATFTRKRFGGPLARCGLVQMSFGLLPLAITRVVGHVMQVSPDGRIGRWALGQANAPLEIALWCLGAFAFWFAGHIVLRRRVYIGIAIACLATAALTTIDHLNIQPVWILPTLALTGLGLAAYGQFDRRRVAQTGEADRYHSPITAWVPTIVLLFGSLATIVTYVVMVTSHGLVFSNQVILAVALTGAFTAVAACLTPGSRIHIAAAWSAMALIHVVAAGMTVTLLDQSWSWQLPALMLLPATATIAGRIAASALPSAPNQIEGPSRIRTLVSSFDAFADGHTWIVVALQMVLLPVAVYAAITCGLTPSVTWGLAVAMLIAGVAMTIETVQRSRAALIPALTAYSAFVVLFTQWAVLPTELLAPAFALVATIGLAIGGVREAFGGSNFAAPAGSPLDQVKGEPSIVLSVVMFLAVLGNLFGLAATMVEPEGATPLHVGCWWVTTGLVFLSAFLSRRVAQRPLLAIGCLALVVTSLGTVAWSEPSPARILEFCVMGIGASVLGTTLFGSFEESRNHWEVSKRESLGHELGMWIGSFLIVLPAITAAAVLWINNHAVPLGDEWLLIALSVLLILTGSVLSRRPITLVGVSTLTLYLCGLVGSLLVEARLATGVYLAIAGALVFAMGIGLSIYRDRMQRWLQNGS